MSELLTKDIGHTEFKDTELGRIPQGWEISNLNENTIFIKDGTHGTHIRYKKGIPLLSAKNITKLGKLRWDMNDSFISDEDYQKIHSKYTIRDSDILLTVVETLGRVAIANTNDQKFSVQRSVAIIRTHKEKLFPQFCFYLFRSDHFQEQLEMRSNSTAQAGVYLGNFQKLTYYSHLLQNKRKSRPF